MLANLCNPLANGGGSGSGGGSGDVTAAGNNSFTGINSFTGAYVTPSNALGAFVVDVTKYLNTKSISADQTFTFSGTPSSNNQWFSLLVTNTDSLIHLITIPSSFDMSGQSPATQFYVLPGGKELITWQYDSVGTVYNAYGIPQENIVPIDIHNAAYTGILTDANRCWQHDEVTARVWTIPANSSVPYRIGTTLTFENENGSGVITIAINTDTMYLAPGGTTGSRTLAANGRATALKTKSAVWQISGVGLT